MPYKANHYHCHFGFLALPRKKENYTKLINHHLSQLPAPHPPNHDEERFIVFPFLLSFKEFLQSYIQFSFSQCNTLYINLGWRRRIRFQLHEKLISAYLTGFIDFLKSIKTINSLHFFI